MAISSSKSPELVSQQNQDLSSRSQDLLVVIGGYDNNDSVQSVEAFSCRENRWIALCEMPDVGRGAAELK